MQPMPAGFEGRQRASLRHEDIAGGKVRRAFRNGQVMMRPGQTMTREEIMAIPYQNRTALIDRFIEVWPSEASKKGPSALEGPTELFIIHVGGGHYKVIEGVERSDRPLLKHEADDLVNQLRPAPPTDS
jgi:hypothetical protein